MALWRVAQRHDKPAAVGWRCGLTAPGVNAKVFAADTNVKCQKERVALQVVGGHASIEGQILGLYLSLACCLTPGNRLRTAHVY